MGVIAGGGNSNAICRAANCLLPSLPGMSVDDAGVGGKAVRGMMGPRCRSTRPRRLDVHWWLNRGLAVKQTPIQADRGHFNHSNDSVALLTLTVVETRQYVETGRSGVSRGPVMTNIGESRCITERHETSKTVGIHRVRERMKRRDGRAKGRLIGRRREGSWSPKTCWPVLTERGGRRVPSTLASQEEGLGGDRGEQPTHLE